MTLPSHGAGMRRFASIGLLALVLAATWVWRIEPVGRDPVTGEVNEGFVARPHPLRTAFEPVMGPPLQVGREPSLRQFGKVGSLWLGAFVILLVLGSWRGSRSCRRAVAVVLGLSAAWTLMVMPGFGLPDRFLAVDRQGVFVDWHLHGGDPHDGRISVASLEARERNRGVGWAVMTPHTAKVEGHSDLARGIWGTEWSGAHLDSFKTLHILVLGGEDAVAAANAEQTEIEAIRVAKARGALVIVAHYWRSAHDRPSAPTIEDLAQAGVDGFEVGNRHREDAEKEREYQLHLDRRSTSLGLLRFSFSDDHGYPAGSRCVTFLENVSQDDLDRGGPAVLALLRRETASAGRAGKARVIPLLFDHAAPGRSVPTALVPPVVLLDYVRELTPAGRLSWLFYGSLAIVWIVVPAMDRRNGALRPGDARSALDSCR